MFFSFFYSLCIFLQTRARIYLQWEKMPWVVCAAAMFKRCYTFLFAESRFQNIYFDLFMGVYIHIFISARTRSLCANWIVCLFFHDIYSCRYFGRKSHRRNDLVFLMESRKTIHTKSPYFLFRFYSLRWLYSYWMFLRKIIHLKAHGLMVTMSKCAA